MKALSLALSVALVAYTAEADDIPGVNRVGRVCDRSIYDGTNEFLWKRAEQFARQFYSENAGRCSILRLNYGVNGKDLSNSYHKPFTEHMSLYPSDLWRRLYVEERPTSPVVRMVALNGAAILQISLEDGIEERLLLGGSDPTWLSFGNSRFRLLHFAAKQYPRDGKTVARFYLRSPDPPNKEHGTALVKHLLALAATDRVVVVVKKDSWFQLVPEFPAIYRFEKNELSYPWGPTPFWVRLLPSFLMRPGPSVLRKGGIMACTAERTGGASCQTSLGE